MEFIAISKRQSALLDFIVREYVQTAKPIPSALVTTKSKLKVSPATIRNEMNSLEEQGFLEQRHTSGGRVPTDKAYRYYVNELLSHPGKLTLDPKDKKIISAALDKAGTDCRAINKTIAKVLSEQSGTLVITGIAQEAEFFKQGLVSLFRHPEFQELDNMFQLTSFFEGFDLMFQLIEREFLRILGAPAGLPIQILIGKENPFHQIKGETIMCTKYLLPGDIIGSLTLIGPKRMNYERNLALIKFTADTLQKINNT
jgi:transcriptional regulator of heat shock response